MSNILGFNFSLSSWSNAALRSSVMTTTCLFLENASAILPCMLRVDVVVEWLARKFARCGYPYFSKWKTVASIRCRMHYPLMQSFRWETENVWTTLLLTSVCPKHLSDQLRSGSWTNKLSLRVSDQALTSRFFVISCHQIQLKYICRLQVLVLVESCC